MTSTGGSAGLLDTNLVILLPRIIDHGPLPGAPLISTITLAELSVGPLLASSAGERAERQATLQQAEALFDPLPFDVNAARAYARVSSDLRRAGRKPMARAFDALIASVAIANGLPLYTANPADFMGITDLQVVPVPHPDHS
ncbi:MAG: type II toxin-antitoxin system VapC family toxin [Chloroflexi bacterium]|nr:type II toxin-antitoxin system VapC family toxin [Chloroflexota bacterium]